MRGSGAGSPVTQACAAFGYGASLVYPGAAVRAPAETVGNDFAAGQGGCGVRGTHLAEKLEVVGWKRDQESVVSRPAGGMGALRDPQGTPDHPQAWHRGGAGDGAAVLHAACQQRAQARVSAVEADHGFSRRMAELLPQRFLIPEQRLQPAPQRADRARDGGMLGPGGGGHANIARGGTMATIRSSSASSRSARTGRGRSS